MSDRYAVVVESLPESIRDILGKILRGEFEIKQRGKWLYYFPQPYEIADDIWIIGYKIGAGGKISSVFLVGRLKGGYWRILLLVPKENIKLDEKIKGYKREFEEKYKPQIASRKLITSLLGKLSVVDTSKYKLQPPEDLETLAEELKGLNEFIEEYKQQVKKAVDEVGLTTERRKIVADIERQLLEPFFKIGKVIREGEGIYITQGGEIKGEGNWTCLRVRIERRGGNPVLIVE